MTKKNKNNNFSKDKTSLKRKFHRFAENLKNSSLQDKDIIDDLLFLIDDYLDCYGLESENNMAWED